MGANNSKKASSRHQGMTEEEQRQLQKVFLVASNDSSHCTAKNFEDFWMEINAQLLATMVRYFFGTRKVIDYETFTKPYVNIVHGTVDEKMEVLDLFLREEEGILTKTVMEYVHSIVRAFLEMLANEESVQSWKSTGCTMSEDRVRMFSIFLCQDLPRSSHISTEQLTSWVSQWSSLQSMEKAVFRNIFGTSNPDILCEVNMPSCLGITERIKSPSILELSDVLFLNSRLPMELRCEWRFLFSTKVHGESFSKFIGNVCNQGASLIIVQDKLGHAFGGFAPDSWRLGPSFFGNASSFLFKLKPTLKIYHPTCYNDHFQYLNTQQQTMPNGLGMGGQLEYFGIWIDAEFGKGSSNESCTTFRGFQMLSSEKDFEIDHLEVWAVGKPPALEEDEEGVSVLDDPKNLETKAILELVGKSQHSDGLREPED